MEAAQKAWIVYAKTSSVASRETKSLEANEHIQLVGNVFREQSSSGRIQRDDSNPMFILDGAYGHQKAFPGFHISIYP